MTYKKISSAEVAKEAGVSRTTVSYVLNNVDTVKIKAETRERVLQAARNLGYFGNSVARSMKTGKAMSIGIVSRWNVTHQRFNEVLNGIRSITDKHGYSITLCNDTLDANGYPEFINYYFAKRIDGIILQDFNNSIQDRAVHLIKSSSIPCVFAGYSLKDIELNCVDINYFSGAYDASRFLLQQGHRKLMCIIHNLEEPQEKQRLDGIHSAIKDYGQGESDLKEIILTDKSDEGHSTIEQALKSKGDCTAVIASWRPTAFKTLYYANKLNIKVPQELAVVSLDGSEFADYSYPALSTSDLPLYEIGEKSASILIDNIEGRELVEQISFNPRLHLREST
jgi:LacI family transcriptional regulator, purine nucleotide synthesis repressor